MSKIRPSALNRSALFACGVLGLSLLAGLFIQDNTSPAALLFVMSPTLVTLALRATGDGWTDSGLRFSGRARAYVLAIALFPLLSGLSVGLGALCGTVKFAAAFGTTFAVAFAKQLLPALVFAFGEEWGWRGYLEPRLAAAGLPALQRHAMIGLLWAVWHVPYILALGDDYTTLPLIVQLPLFHIAVIAMAFIWGPLRTQTQSAWPAILSHGVANAVAFPLLNPELVTISNPLWFAARPEGLVTLVGLSVAAVVVYRTTSARHQP